MPLWFTLFFLKVDGEGEYSSGEEEEEEQDSMLGKSQHFKPGTLAEPG